MKPINREKKVLKDIENWELTYFNEAEKNTYFALEANLNHVIDSWQPDAQKKLLNTLDSIIFHIYAIIQNSKYEDKVVLKVLDHGRVFDANIEEISDMKRLTIDQLRFIGNQFLARQRIAAFSQGAVTGIGGLFFITLDLPLILTINLRSIQLIAITYGYDLKNPYELMLVLKLFHIATLPKTIQKEGWGHLLQELNAQKDEWFLFDEKSSYKSTVWLQQLIKQIGKSMILMLLKNKLIQGIPLFGMTVGASANYFLASQISEIAHNFYQKRFLMEKNNEKAL